mgnify:CR=1 FL=1
MGGSIVLFIIIALLIKRGMVDGRGFTDIAKIFGGIAVFLLIISLLTSPFFWGILGLAIVGIVVAIITLSAKYSGDKRAKTYGWDSAEYQAKYSEALAMFKDMYRNQRDEAKYNRMNVTEQRVQELKEEKMAREAAGKYVDEQFMKKYGTNRTVNQANQGNRSNAANQGNRSSMGSQGGPAPAYGDPNTVTGSYGRTATQQAARHGSGMQYGAAGAAASQAMGARAREKTIKDQTRALKSSILPKSAARRTRIVRKFNEQYNLYLTDDQIKRIVDASYMSVAWKNEVEAMASKYDSVYQWLVGDTAYLRAYLKVFAVQDVTSDFPQQMQIVMDSFEEIFDYSDTISGLTLERRIEMINSKFLTNFDDITYMIAYRYLESLGLHHELGQTQINRIDGTFDDLVAKYDSMSDADVDAALAGAAPLQGSPRAGGAGQ